MPRRWIDERATVIVTAGRKVACARCDGGGCDACGRSGVVRLDDDEAARSFALLLPERIDAGAVVRLVRPFGDTSPVAQVLCEIRPSDAAEGCRRDGEPVAALVPSPRPGPLVHGGAYKGPLVLVVGTVLALVAWLLAHAR